MSKHTPPATYPRRVLLSVMGMSPAILTETLWALKQQDPPFIPTEIKVITTQHAQEQIQTHLLGKSDKHKGGFLRYCADFDIDASIFTTQDIQLIKNKQGKPLDDIVSPGDNQDVANIITATLEQLSKDDNCAIHVSLAGGRKTMGYYAGYALSLFGREQDRLSHVLVESKYENCGDFYYPTPYSHIVHQRHDNKAKYDAQYAHIDLAEIPFVRINKSIPPALLKGDITFNQAVFLANLNGDTMQVAFKEGEKALFINDIRIDSDNLLNVAFLKMVLDAQQEERSIPVLEKDKSPSLIIARDLAECLAYFSLGFQYDQAIKIDDATLLDELAASGIHKKTLDALSCDEKTLCAGFKMIDPRLSGCNTFLKKALGDSLLQSLRISKTKNSDGQKVYLSNFNTQHYHS